MAKKKKQQERRFSRNMAKNIALNRMNQNEIAKSVFSQGRSGSMSPTKKRLLREPVRRGSIDLRKMFGNQGKLDDETDNYPESHRESSGRGKNNRVSSLLKAKKRRSSMSGFKKGSPLDKLKQNDPQWGMSPSPESKHGLRSSSFKNKHKPSLDMINKNNGNFFLEED